jgi:deoxyadenosine/deoxycytidine kinase
MAKDITIGVVGPCAAGKTTLINNLEEKGYYARHIAQEHSYVKDMWERISKPSLLIYLEVSYENTIIRKRLKWSRNEYQTQIERLCHARNHADIYIDTNKLSSDEVFAQAIEGIQQQS